MPNWNTSKVNLNLLLNLKALIEERSITRASRRMLIGQPTMSKALDRLRKIFKEELLVRTPNGYEPTHRAREIYAELEQILPRINALLCEKEFDPAKASRRFDISATDYGARVVLPQLMKEIQSVAPGIHIEISTLDEDTFRKLEINVLDLAFRVSDAPRPLRSDFLYEERHVCLLRRGHPVGNQSLTLKQYLKLKHVVVSASGGRQRAIEQVLARHNCKRDVQLKVPYYTLVGSIIAQTDLVATIPQRLAINLLKTSKVKIVRAPIEFPEFNYVQVWHPRHDLDPAHKWLRELIKKTSTRET